MDHFDQFVNIHPVIFLCYDRENRKNIVPDIPGSDAWETEKMRDFWDLKRNQEHMTS